VPCCGVVHNIAITRATTHIGKNTKQNTIDYSNYYLQQVKQKKNQLKITRKQPMKINPRPRNKNRMIVVLVDQRRSTRNVVDLRRDNIYFVVITTI